MRDVRTYLYDVVSIKARGLYFGLSLYLHPNIVCEQRMLCRVYAYAQARLRLAAR